MLFKKFIWLQISPPVHHSWRLSLAGLHLCGGFLTTSIRSLKHLIYEKLLEPQRRKRSVDCHLTPDPAENLWVPEQTDEAKHVLYDNKLISLGHLKKWLIGDSVNR